MELSQTKEDIEIAQKIINNGYNIVDEASIFYNQSFIYQYSNEEIFLYQSYLQNRNKILSVTSSGDQILSSILLGTKEVDSFDISRFPQYYVELKKSAILSLSREEFLKFFSKENILLSSRDEVHKIFSDNPCISRSTSSEIYAGINHNLKAPYKLFWDELLKNRSFFDLCNSSLFQFVYLDIMDLISTIPYLQNNHYEILKQKLKEIEIKYQVGNIFELASSMDDSYDLVYLSNIIDHGDSQDKFQKYQTLLNQFNLKDNGIILTYIINHFNEDEMNQKSSMEHELHSIDIPHSVEKYMISRKRSL